LARWLSRMANWTVMAYGTMTVAEAKNRFSDVLRRAEYGGERVIVERHGKPVAAIVSTEDLRRLETTDDAVDLEDARAALAEAKRRRRPALSGTALSRVTAPNALWCADCKGEFLLEDRRYCYPLTITDLPVGICSAVRRSRARAKPPPSQSSNASFRNSRYA
jgi:prevent-host-death family protein